MPHISQRSPHPEFLKNKKAHNPHNGSGSMYCTFTVRGRRHFLRPPYELAPLPFVLLAVTQTEERPREGRAKPLSLCHLKGRRES